MGPNATPKEIGDEAAKRWKEMSEKDRKVCLITSFVQKSKLIF